MKVAENANEQLYPDVSREDILYCTRKNLLSLYPMFDIEKAIDFGNEVVSLTENEYYVNDVKW